MTSVFVAAPFAYYGARTGNPALLLPALQGEVAVISFTQSDLGSHPPGSDVELNFSIHNLTNSPLKLSGSQSTCTCVTARGLPATIPRYSGHPMLLRWQLPTEPGDYSQEVRYFIEYNSNELRNASVKLAATVVAAQSGRDLHDNP